MTKWRIPSATVNAHFYRTVKHGRVKRGRVGSSGRVRSRRRRSRYNVSHIEALRDAVPVCSSEMRDTVRQIPLPAPRQASDNRRLGSPRFLFPPPLSLRVDRSVSPSPARPASITRLECHGVFKITSTQMDAIRSVWTCFCNRLYTCQEA